MRGKCVLSPGVQPPTSHILPLKTRAPAPSRGANGALFVTGVQRYVCTSCEAVTEKAALFCTEGPPLIETRTLAVREGASGTFHSNRPALTGALPASVQVLPSSVEKDASTEASAERPSVCQVIQ